MSKQIVKTENNSIVNSNIMESLVIKGDLSGMNQIEKTQYYMLLCNSLGLNPATQPFELIRFQGKEKLYAKKDATEQLRKIHGISTISVEEKTINDLFIVKITVKDKTGRQDIASGSVPIANLKGESLANAYMKAETKAKRRATLSICGLGMLDESELDSIGKYDKLDIESDACSVLITEIETVGNRIYGDTWELKKRDLCVALTKSRCIDLTGLTESELNRLKTGINKNQIPNYEDKRTLVKVAAMLQGMTGIDFINQEKELLELIESIKAPDVKAEAIKEMKETEKQFKGK